MYHFKYIFTTIILDILCRFSASQRPPPPSTVVRYNATITLDKRVCERYDSSSRRARLTNIGLKTVQNNRQYTMNSDHARWPSSPGRMPAVSAAHHLFQSRSKR